MDWIPKVKILADSAGGEPTKPSKPSSVGFDGAIPGESAEIDAQPNATDLARASAVLKATGARIMTLEEGPAVGVWSDLDAPEVRAALRTFGSDGLPILYLDGLGVPGRYKLRRVKGEPVPLNVLRAMEAHPGDPWTIRDRMLQDMRWNSKKVRHLCGIVSAEVRRGRQRAISRPNAGGGSR
jgi:hypothetical protein